MRYLIASFVLSVVALGVLAEEKKPPAKLTFEAKMGNITYDHAAHLQRAKGDCKVCHDKLWPQEKAPLNFKAGVHKPAEAGHTSCGACHAPGGMAFESKGNCNKCHVKAAAKQG
jgi:c(7)-type cytochrome triheme protein